MVGDLDNVDGHLRHRVELLVRHSQPNEIGEEVYQYVHTADRWADVVPTGETEAIIGERQVTRRLYDIRMRYDSQISNAHRLKWNDCTLEITSVVDIDNRQREMLLKCVEAL